RFSRDWSSDVCSSDLLMGRIAAHSPTVWFALRTMRYSVLLQVFGSIRPEIAFVIENGFFYFFGFKHSAQLCFAGIALHGREILRSEERRVGTECMYRW